MVFNSTLSTDTNLAIQIFLAAGARFSKRKYQEDNIKMCDADWCSFDTFKMIIECHEKSFSAILRVVQSKHCDAILPDLLKTVSKSVAENLLDSLCGQAVEYPSLLENDEYLEKISEVSSKTFSLALEKQFPESFILKILNKCKKIDDDIIILKFAFNYSETVILEILNKFDKLLYQDLILFKAIKQKCPESVLEKIVDKSSKIRSQAIDLAKQQGGYSENLFVKMRNKL